MTGKPELLLADANGIATAAELLRAGHLVAVPTETVYGLAARADSASAVAQIYLAKGRPDFNPLIVHVPDVSSGQQYAEFDERALKLAAAFWPGALTMVLPLRSESGIAPAVTAGLPTIAMRCPAHPVMQAVLKASKVPLAAPSANRSGGISPSCANHVVASLGSDVDFVLDGGPCASGIESTIVALRDFGWEVLRPGPITAAEIEAVLGSGSVSSLTSRIEAPGQLSSHYSPGKPVRLGVRRAESDEFLIGFGAVAGEINLSPSGDLVEAASRLYDCLYMAQKAPHHRIAIAPIPNVGIGVAINDRLRRAAA